MKENVSKVTKNGICSSCGICASVCPKKCIEYKKEKGQFVPEINFDKCINCGICLTCCPGINRKYISSVSQDNNMTGDFLKSYVGYYNDHSVRNNSTSGGLVIGVIKELLSANKYDAAFLVDTFNYNSYVETKIVKNGKINDSHNKSRYISVSNQNLINHILKNKNEKIIIVAVGCAVQGILNVIEKHKLNRDNYLILGLFCDRSLNYNIFNYFDDMGHFKGKLDKLYFRTKEQSGWPGNVKIVDSNKKTKFLSAQSRMLVKDHFQLESCLYCIDKLNKFADISLGDNYTKIDSDFKGSNSIIVRTKKGLDVLEQFKDKFTLKEIDINKIYSSQKIMNKKSNLKNARLLYNRRQIKLYSEIIDQVNINKEDEKRYNRSLKKINIGKNYHNSKINLFFQVRVKQICLKIISILRGKNEKRSKTN